ncbi:MAG: acyl-CoA thioesterase [Gammaproteobacteria bacterium]
MKPILKELIGLLMLERLEDNLFRGPSRDIGTRRVYGGQVLGQALRAAQYTVEDRQIHSLHAYFLREGDHKTPIVYEVDRSRDGRSFAARRVVAVQHGRPIFTLSASFQKAETGLEYQSDMPANIAAPDSLPGMQKAKSNTSGRLPEKVQQMGDLTAPFDLRPLPTGDTEPRRQFWFKSIDTLPEDPNLHRSILAYFSDYGLLPTTLMPHGFNSSDDRLIMASIDHAMWFHRPFRVDQWLLYDLEALSTSGARGLARGAIYRQDGIMVATTVQEGLVRLKTTAVT